MCSDAVIDRGRAGGKEGGGGNIQVHSNSPSLLSDSLRKKRFCKGSPGWVKVYPRKQGSLEPNNLDEDSRLISRDVPLGALGVEPLGGFG